MIALGATIMMKLGEKLKQKHLKVTPQRLAIYNMLYHSTAHPTAETVYRALEPTCPGLSLATVYKTLDSLCAAGLIQALNVGEGRFRYDANSEEHPHFICRSCEQVFDAHGISGIDMLRKQAAETLGAEISNEQIYFYGTCKDCLANTKTE